MFDVALTPPKTPLDREVTIPGSKSYTNRALIMAALAPGKSVLRSASLSGDSQALCAALEKFGVGVTIDRDTVTVEAPFALRPYAGVIDVGPAGTTCRFLTALCALTPGCEVELRGSERLHERPINDLVDALTSAGCEISYLGKPGCPPLLINGRSLHGSADIAISGAVSSQFISAVLLCAPLFRGGLRLSVIGEQTSKSYIDMTLDGLKSFGVEIVHEGYREYRVRAGSQYTPREYQVEGDASGASYLWGLAAMTAGRVRVRNINPNSAQGDVRFPDLLGSMGCSVSRSPEKQPGAGWIEVRASAPLNAIAADMTLMPDTAQTLAVIAAAVRGETRLSGLGTLRVKETDRIAALAAELKKAGIDTKPEADALTIVGGTPKGADVETYDDHRMAMSFALFGAKVPGMVIKNAGVVEKSFPTFWETLEGVGVGVKRIER